VTATDPLTPAKARASLIARFAAFLAERHPFAMQPALEAMSRIAGGGEDAAAIDALRAPLRTSLEQHLSASLSLDPSMRGAVPETTPGVNAPERLMAAVDEVIEACDGFLRRESIRASLTPDERREILRGMILTRATDNRLKAFFTGGEVRYGSASFQGKGFRSLGQEAIYAAVIRLRRGGAWRASDGTWRGDVISPMIRDLGAALAMRPEMESIRMVLSAQMGKAGPPMNGKDLHVGDFDWGILPPTAPLSTPALTIAGLAFSFWYAAAHPVAGSRLSVAGAEESSSERLPETVNDLTGYRLPATGYSSRVAVSFIGEGASSLGEWHEAINLCAARKLPAVFCIQNNQTALSTPVREQSAVRVFADKAIGYGIPAVTIDGTDPDAVASAFTWAVERARQGHGPALIELIAMRMCGHAHHDDMLYLGKDPQPSWDYPPLTEQGYANREAYEFWCGRDPIPTYAARLEADGVLRRGELEQWKKEAEAAVDAEARKVIDAPWPVAASAGEGVFANEKPRVRVEVLDGVIPSEARVIPGEARNPGAGNTTTVAASDEGPRPDPSLDARDDTLEARDDRFDARDDTLPELNAGPPFDPKGKTFLEAVMLGVGDALRKDPRVFVYGEDVGGKYGNAFLLLKPLLSEFGDRIINSTLAEGGTLGVCIGAALGGLRPIGEIQFNDFVATGFNQLVNNAAKIRYRWGGEVPMVVRMPWGGLRHAGPYHSQNTEPWFYRTPGLKIVTPSTPYDARAAMAAAVADPDPVLYYEHIALYRDPRIKQQLSDEAPAPMELGRAALRRAGDDLAIISYGAYVHMAMRVAEQLAADGIESSVLDLRSVVPLDRQSILRLARHCNRVLIIHEDTRTGGIGESVAAIIQEEAFDWLDAPIRIIGALDTPVPYSPPLEEFFLPSAAEIERAARLLVAY
jgi:pyruvate/2-oxoglutarate/acetoin dehydrogenase E1 component/TPP-dependent pyruvate/acetoin dehydrogenase alpha subunit